MATLLAILLSLNLITSEQSKSITQDQTYPGELKARTKALDSQTIEDNRVSWGCINADQKVFDQYLLPTFNKSSVYKIFILPDSPDQVFVP